MIVQKGEFTGKKAEILEYDLGSVYAKIDNKIYWLPLDVFTKDGVGCTKMTCNDGS